MACAGQRLISTIFTQSSQYRVVLEVQPEFRKGPNALSEIYVGTSAGTQVPLSTVTRLVEKPYSLILLMETLTEMLSEQQPS